MAIAYYQKLGCWAPHVEITRPAFEVALDVFQHARLITRRHRYEDVVAPPPVSASMGGRTPASGRFDRGRTDRHALPSRDHRHGG